MRLLKNLRDLKDQLGLVEQKADNFKCLLPFENLAYKKGQQH